MRNLNQSANITKLANFAKPLKKHPLHTTLPITDFFLYKLHISRNNRFLCKVKGADATNAPLFRKNQKNFYSANAGKGQVSPEANALSATQARHEEIMRHAPNRQAATKTSATWIALRHPCLGATASISQPHNPLLPKHAGRRATPNRGLTERPTHSRMASIHCGHITQNKHSSL